MIADWLLIAIVFVVLFAIWRFFNYVADLFESHRQAAKLDGEDA